MTLTLCPQPLRQQFAIKDGKAGGLIKAAAQDAAAAKGNGWKASALGEAPIGCCRCPEPIASKGGGVTDRGGRCSPRYQRSPLQPVQSKLRGPEANGGRLRPQVRTGRNLQWPWVCGRDKPEGLAPCRTQGAAEP